VDSPKPLTRSQIRLRLAQVRMETGHLGPLIWQPDHPANRMLRISDIARYLNVTPHHLNRRTLLKPPKTCPYGCATIERCTGSNSCIQLKLPLQQALSDFFIGWDSGALVKARFENRWRVVRRPEGASLPGTARVDAPQIPAPPPAVPAEAPRMIRMQIDRATLGLKVL